MIYGRVESDGLRCMYHGWLFDNCGRVVLRGEWLPEKERRWDVGQPAYPCVEAGGVIFTYMAQGGPPPLPPYEFVSQPAENRALTKTLHSDNYLPAIGGATEPATGLSRFILPSLTLFQAASPSVESILRWRVPVDDHSHLEYPFQFAGELQSVSEPRAAACDVLLRAVRKLRAEQQTRDESTEKIR